MQSRPARAARLERWLPAIAVSPAFIIAMLFFYGLSIWITALSFTNIWNDFLFALVLAPSDSQTVTVGLNNLITVVEDRPEYNVHMAAALIAALPTALVYVVAGKHFVRGLTAGAVKG